jgi:hypothetical protein
MMTPLCKSNFIQKNTMSFKYHYSILLTLLNESKSNTPLGIVLNNK